MKLHYTATDEKNNAESGENNQSNSGCIQLTLLRLFKKNCFAAALIVLLMAGNNLAAQTPVITADITLPNGANPGIRGVVFGNGFYITVTYSGKIYKSADGEAWTKISGTPAATVNCLAFGAGIFVIGGINGQVLTSTDGINWTNRTSGTSEYINDVQYIQSAFYAVGNNATVITSTDGINWSPITLGVGVSTNQLRNICYGAGIFSIGLTNSGGDTYAYRSTTGASNSWTYQLVATFKTLNKIKYLKDKFYAFTASTDVFSSPDLINWTNITSTTVLTLPNATTQTIGSPNQAFDGLYDGTKIYMFGYSNYYGANGAVFSSADGLNFILEDKTAIITGGSCVYTNGKYFQIGNEGLISSTNGTSYHFATGSYTALASSGSSFVGVGTNGRGLIFSSPDFVNWTDRSMYDQKELYGVAYSGSKYLAVGKNTAVESTNNGVSWTEIANPAYNFNTLTYGGGKFVAAGITSPGNNARISYSANGSSWTDASTSDNYYFRVKYVNGNYFALGYSNSTYEGVVMNSTDGISWTDITPSLAFPVYYFNDVVYDGAKFHLMGMEYTDLVTYNYKEFFSISTATINNAVSWANKGTVTAPPVAVQLGGTYGEGAFEYSNGHFAGAVNDISSGQTYTVYSSDGVNWIADAVDANSNIGGATVAGDVFRFLGNGDGKITLAYTGPLPVKLLSFTATATGNHTNLQWQTSTELNSKNFEVQFSTDSKQWTTLAKIAAAGNSSTMQHYSYMHDAPQKGNNYYRLQLNDLDSKFVFSDIKLVQFNTAATGFTLLYNPVQNGIIQVQVTVPGEFSMYNSNGQLSWKQKLDAGTQKINVSRLAKGIYVLKAGSTVQELLLQ